MQRIHWREKQFGNVEMPTMPSTEELQSDMGERSVHAMNGHNGGIISHSHHRPVNTVVGSMRCCLPGTLPLPSYQ